MRTWRDSGEQQFDLFAAQACDQAGGATEDGVGQRALGLLQLQHLFFDGVAGNQSVSEDAALLVDAMGAIDGLSFGGRIPPGVENEDVVGSGQIEAHAAGLQADQKKLHVWHGLKTLNRGGAVARPAVEIFVRNPHGVEPLAQQIEQAGELREDQRLVALSEDFLESVQKLGKEPWKE